MIEYQVIICQDMLSGLIKIEPKFIKILILFQIIFLTFKKIIYPFLSWLLKQLKREYFEFI